MASISSVVRKMTTYQLNNYDANAFVELFHMCMLAHCSVNCRQTFYVESVHTKCAPWRHKFCHGVLI